MFSVHCPSRPLPWLGGQGVNLTIACLALPAWGDCPAYFGPVGDIRLRADLSTLRPLPWHPTHAIAHTTMNDPVTTNTWMCCPRGQLRRVLGLAAEQGKADWPCTSLGRGLWGQTVTPKGS